MKRLLPVFFLIMTVPAFAQDSPSTQKPDSTESGYGGGDYGKRAEVFVTGFGLFTREANGNGIGQKGTNAAGGSAGYRFSLNESSALEGRYGFSRNSQKYSMDSTVSSIPVYFSEISGSYVYNFLKFRRVRVFAEGGGGLALFSPSNYGGGTTGYNGSSSGLGRQAKAMFVYGAGADVPASSGVSLRVEFRSLGYKAPDFGLAALQANAFSFAYEPSVGVAFHF